MELHSFFVDDEELCISAERSIFWEKEKALILSDLHLGKTGHFRKSGIAVPQNVYKEDLHRLMHLVQFFKAEQLIIVGDMVHSHENRELDLFVRWRNDIEQVEVNLVRGNHDILSAKWYENAGVKVHEGSWNVRGFCFQHDAGECETADEGTRYLFSGHIHPGIVIHGLGKQSLRFPCYYFTQTTCVLPAFSRFTGAASIQPQLGDTVFAIVNQSLVELNY
jgi:uncharacterized protein